MPMARTKRGRIRQVHRWLEAEFPAPHPVRVSICKVKKDYGDCDLIKSGVLHVRVNCDLDWYASIEWLLHEYAHAVAWGKEKNAHDRAWSDRYGRIYRRWHNKGGAEESRKL